MSEYVEQAAQELATPAPEAAPAPEPAVAPQSSPAPAPQPEQRHDEVPSWAQNALREERTKRQGLERTVEDLNRRLEALSKPPAPVDEPPDREKDPLGWVEWWGRKGEEREKAWKERQQQDDQQRQQQEATHRFLGDYRARAAAYAETQPEFGNAYAYLREHRAKELAAFGVADPGHREQVLMQEEFNLVQAAMANGVDPAAAIWQAATLRGFAVKQPEPEPAAETDPTPRDPATGQFRAAAPPPPAPKPPRSLSHAPGAPGGQLTGASLLAMSGEEFDRAFAGGDGWRSMHRR